MSSDVVHDESPLAGTRLSRRMPNSGAAADILLSPGRITFCIGAVIVFLISASLAGQIAKYQFGRPTLLGMVDLFYVDLEANLPAIFQAFHLLFASIILCAIGIHERRTGSRYARHWFILAAGFLLLAFDEGGVLHERLIYLMHRFIQLDGIWASLWVIPGLMLAGVVALYFRRFVLQMPAREGLQVVAAGVVFVSGAIGVEMATSGMFDTTAPDWKESYRYALMVHVEELLEMTGVLLFNRFLLYRVAGRPPVSLAVRES